MSENIQTNIAPANEESLTVNLRRLMNAKGITEAELARCTNTPQPTLHKILAGKTEDPRASTLKALADFFDISIDQLLTGAVTISNSNDSIIHAQSIPIISWADCLTAHDFVKTLKPGVWPNWVISEPLSENAYGLVSKPSMESRFPRGTILIVDLNITPQDGDIVVAHYPHTEEATIRELHIDGPTKLLLPISTNSNQSLLDSDILLVGTLVKTIFSYHSSMETSKPK